MAEKAAVHSLKIDWAPTPRLGKGTVSKARSATPPQLVSRIQLQWLKSATALLVGSLLLCAFSGISAAASSSRSFPRQAGIPSNTTLLEDFEVYPPVLTLTPNGVLEITDGSSNATHVVGPDPEACQVVLLADYSFANSYGVPFVANYTPPPCDFNRVTWNLTVVSAGVQYDRLSIVYLGDIEVFRTSTAEPTQNGVRWTYLKDMTSYLSLFKTDQKLIFELDNLLIAGELTGAYNVTLTASFFVAEDTVTPADLIIPVSSRQSTENAASVFTVPPEIASNLLTVPRNIKRAVFTIAATGQSAEEFWWSNVLQSEVDTFPQSGALYGYSPFREVQLFIDGNLAGVAWPFPVIFTGGVVPGFWQPIVGIDAFDLKEDEIDVTPWLPLLCDGNAHNFTIRVSGLNDNGNGTASLSETTDSYWLVTGKLFIWLDSAGHVTTGDGPYAMTPTPKFQVSSSIGTGINGTNQTLLYSVQAARNLAIQSTIHLSTGSSTVFWQQNRTFSNTGNYTDAGNVEINSQQTTGYDISSSGYARSISYPLYVDSVYATFGDNISIVASLTRGKDVDTAGQPVFPTGLESFMVDLHDIKYQGASLTTTQNGSASYIANETSGAAYSFGSTEQVMSLTGFETSRPGHGHSFPTLSGEHELFQRHVLAVNSSVVEDEEVLLGSELVHTHGSGHGGNHLALSGLVGRGGDWHGRWHGQGA